MSTSSLGSVHLDHIEFIERPNQEFEVECFSRMEQTLTKEQLLELIEQLKKLSECKLYGQ